MTIDEQIERYSKLRVDVTWLPGDAVFREKHRDHCAEHFPAMLNALRGAQLIAWQSLCKGNADNWRIALDTVHDILLEAVKAAETIDQGAVKQ